VEYTRKTGECCDRLGKLGAQISIHEHRLQELGEEGENISNLVQETVSGRVNQFFDDLQSGS
jgi:hypothetical protein